MSAFASNSSTLCDAAHKQSTSRTIHISVIPVNKPPSISLKDGNSTGKVVKVSTFAMLDGGDMALPAMIMTDPDANLSSYKTSYGIERLPPVSVTLTTVMGRLTIDPSVRVKTPFLQGRGLAEKSISLFAPLNQINEALATVMYQCRSADGCSPGLDNIQIMVSDEGFSGLGGALTDQMILKVQVQGKDGSLGNVVDEDHTDSDQENDNNSNNAGGAYDNTSGASSSSSSESDLKSPTAEPTVNMEDYITNFPRRGSPEEGTDQFSSSSPGYRRLIDFVDDADIVFN